MAVFSPRSILIWLLGLLGLGALGGGGLLVIAPTGRLLGMPVAMLAGSPFADFLVPGIVLFTVLGVAPCLLVVALLKKPQSPLAERLNCFGDMHWAWTGSIYVAFALILWIQLEMVFLNAVNWLHTVYMVWAIAILFVALLPSVRRRYKKPEMWATVPAVKSLLSAAVSHPQASRIQ
ncbi:hypothetical protein ACVWYF_003958 [Hymenobacter sp. UYAg731]